MRVGVSIDCTECKRKNYTTSKNKQKTTDKLEMKNSANFVESTPYIAKVSSVGASSSNG